MKCQIHQEQQVVQEQVRSPSKQGACGYRCVMCVCVRNAGCAFYVKGTHLGDVEITIAEVSRSVGVDDDGME